MESLAALSEVEAREALAEIGEAALRRFAADWPAWVHRGQDAPEGEEWRVWVMMAGRGFGKTRAGAEWVSGFARRHPGAKIALVGATPQEARRVMVEGPSGLLAAARPGELEATLWEPSRGRLRFASGAEAFVYSGANPEGLRGPEHDIAWCDELAKWKRAQEAWDNLQLGLRRGERPKVLVTTTPRTVGALKAVLGIEGAMMSGGAMDSNPHLPDCHVEAMRREHDGTRLGRQELDGEMVHEVEGALWTRAAIERARVAGPAAREKLERVVIGVDPPASIGGACGIVAAGVDGDGIFYVLGDHSVRGVAPEGWARKVAAAAQAWGADRVVAEANNGGAMVRSVLEAADSGLAVTLTHAAEGKSARAAPVAVLFENGRAKFAGRFPELEDELAGLSWSGPYQGPGTSPDRADAMVWALTELVGNSRRAMPRVRAL